MRKKQYTESLKCYQIALKLNTHFVESNKLY